MVVRTRADEDGAPNPSFMPAARHVRRKRFNWLVASVAGLCVVFALGGWILGKIGSSVPSGEPVRGLENPAAHAPPQLPAQPKEEPDYSRWSLDKKFRWESEDLNCVAFSPDGRIIAVGGGISRNSNQPDAYDGLLEQGVVQLWDVITREAKGRFSDLGDEARTLAFYPDGLSLAIGDRRKMKVVDVRTGGVKFVVPFSAFDGLAINGQEGILATSFGQFFWDMANGDQKPSFVRMSMNDPIFSPDGRLFFVNSALWDVKTGQKIVPVNAFRPTFTHDSRFLGASNGVWEIDGARTVWWNPDIQQAGSGRTTGTAFTPDDRFLLTSSLDGNLVILEAGSGRPAFSFRPHNQIAGIALSPNGRVLVTLGRDARGDEAPIKTWTVALRPVDGQGSVIVHPVP